MTPGSYQKLGVDSPIFGPRKAQRAHDQNYDPGTPGRGVDAKHMPRYTPGSNDTGDLEGQRHPLDRANSARFSSRVPQSGTQDDYNPRLSH